MTENQEIKDRTFDSLMGELREYLKQDSSVLKDFEIQSGSNQKWAQVNDHSDFPVSSACHYEIFRGNKTSQEIYVDLHFEDGKKNNSYLRKYIGEELPEGVSWYEKKIRVDKSCKITDPEAVSKLRNNLLLIENSIGDKLRMAIRSNFEIIVEKLNTALRNTEEQASFSFIANKDYSQDETYFKQSEDYDIHYELLYDKEHKTIAVELHFEQGKKSVQNAKFESELSINLTDGWEWDSDWEGGLRIKDLEPVNTNNTKLISALQSRLLSLDKAVSNKVNSIILKMTPSKQPLNQILYGPPGTGKTYNSIKEAVQIANPSFNLNQGRDKIKKEYDWLSAEGQIVFTTFHQSMTYEDFVEGIKPQEPKEEGQPVTYKVEDGIFKRICELAIDSSQANYVLIIDEINRGNVSAIFGELITLIEESKRQGNDEALSITLPYSKAKFSVPNNLYIIGTMNTADRSVEALDTALRRRFSFTEMPPKPELIENEGNQINKVEVDGEALDLTELLKTINQRIELLLDRDHLIGHSFFMKVTDAKSLRSAIGKEILPLLQEYFYGDYGKIALVLGEGFCKGKEPESQQNIFATVEHYDGDVFSDKVIFRITDPTQLDSDGEYSMNEKKFAEALNKLLNRSTKQSEGA